VLDRLGRPSKQKHRGLSKHEAGRTAIRETTSDEVLVDGQLGKASGFASAHDQGIVERSERHPRTARLDAFDDAELLDRVDSLFRELSGAIADPLRKAIAVDHHGA
jgi:hypothetical protein